MPLNQNVQNIQDTGYDYQNSIREDEGRQAHEKKNPHRSSALCSSVPWLFADSDTAKLGLRARWLSKTLGVGDIRWNLE